MKNRPHLKTILLLLLSICLLSPLQPALADSTASVTIGTAASSNGSWSGASPDVWTPGDSGVSTVAVSDITDRLANSGVVITAGSSITVAAAVSWASSNPLTLNAGTDISINAAINATSGALKLYYGQSTADGSGYSHSLGSGAQLNLSAGTNFFSKQGSSGSEITWTVITSLGSAGSTTGTDLQGIRGNLSGYYVLGDDIDALATSSWNSNGSGGYYGFTPIGNDSTSFVGSFDGLGHTISNLYINRSSTDYVGLFGYTLITVRIRNLGLTSANIIGHDYIGALAGKNSATISNAYSTGSVTGNDNVGGLVGMNYYSSTISNTYVTSSVSGSGRFTGGLAGYNYGTISNAYATGSVSGTDTVGGLAGFNYGSISNAYATGSVSGTNIVGGLSGSNSNGGSISNAYATGSVSGDSYLGGLVGNNSGGTLTTAYAIGRISGTTVFFGGLVGWYSGGTFTNTYYDTTVYSGNACGLGTCSGVTGKTTTQLAADLPAGFDTAVWGNGNNQTTPYLLANASFAASSGSVILGSDSSSTPTRYEVILNATQLQSINSTGLSGSYVLGADIDALATSEWNSNGSGGYYGFNQIGSNTTPFTGSFNGLGHIVSDLYINRSSTTYMGLFGYNSGSISNLGVAGGSITGKNRVGGLVGHNSGSISNAYASATITGVYSVGGLVGYNYGGSISNAYATGSASGTNSYTGGLVGWNSGSINYAYALGTVTGITTDTGGLVGYNSGSISNAFAIGSVSGVSNVGGLVGNNDGGTYSNDFWNSTTTGQAYGAGGSTTPTGVTGLTTSQMQSASSFSAWGTDISATGGSSAIWRIYNGYTYPLLRSFMTTLSITPAFDGSGTPLTNIADITATSYNPGLVLGSASPLTLSSSSDGSYIASVNTSGLYSSQQGYDLSYSNRTISTPGSTAGNILIANPITWTSGTLAFNTSGSITATATINGSVSAVFDLQSGSWSQNGSLPDFSVTDFRISGGSFIRVQGGDGTSNNPYQIADSYGLQGIGTLADMLTKSYQLANDISASGTATWNSGAGFKPIGTSSHTFTGSFDGQSHTINGLYINRGSETLVGLFGINYGTIGNLTLTNANVTGNFCVGALVGCNMEGGSISNVSVQGSVVATDELVGLVAGGNNDGGTISNATASGSVSGASNVGGLVGTNWGSLSNASASVTVTGIYDYVGGLAGESAGSISNSHATGNVSGSNDYVGGLVGANNLGTASDAGRITDVYATGTVSGVNFVGGLIGSSDAGSVISNAYATGNVTGSGGVVGGLAGYGAGSISASYATGSVNGSGDYTGGLVGWNDYGSISASYATGNVTNSGIVTGGLVGENNGSISNSYATGTVSGVDFVGGLIGSSDAGSVISNTYASGTVTGSLYVGGLVGVNNSSSSSISNNYASGSVSSSAYAGGLVGWNSGSISNNYATGSVTGSGSGDYTGGLVGWNSGSISNSFFNTDNTSQSSAVDYDSGTLTNVTGKTTSELKTASSFSSAGWGISATGGSSAIWRIYEGNTYPLLRSFLIPMSVTANNAAKNYDATPYSGGNGVQYAPAGYNPARVAGSLTYGGTAQGATAIGSYTITPDGLFSDQLGYDIAFISGVLNINGYWLTLGISGSGTVNSSNGSGLGYACNTATCTAVPFGSGDSVTLIATGSNSTFSGWSGDITVSTNPYSFTITGNTAVTATFTSIPAVVKIDGNSTQYYSINTALSVPAQDATIRATATGFAENVTMQNSHTLTLKGGYSDNNFTSQTGYSTINGSLTISSGTLIVDRVVVGP